MNARGKRSLRGRMADALHEGENPVVDQNAATPEARELQTQTTGNAWERSVAIQTNTAFQALRRNSILNFFVRMSLYTVAIGALAWAVYYVTNRGDSMVGVLINQQAQDFREDKLLGLAVPVLLMVALAAAALLAALYIQSRGVNDYESGLEGISRLRREAQAGVSRSRTLTHIVEEFLDNSRRAFRLQLWLARALFIICLILFSGAVANAVAEGDAWISLAMAGGSLGALLLAVLRGAPQEVGNRLADSTQLQMVVSNTTREVNMIEEFVYKTIEAKEHADDWGPAVREGVQKMEDLTARSLNLIQLYVEPQGEPDQQARQLGIDDGPEETTDAEHEENGDGPRGANGGRRAGADTATKTDDDDERLDSKGERPPVITRIRPDRAAPNADLKLVVHGQRFRKGAKVRVGDRLLPAKYTKYRGEDRLAVSVPANHLPPGALRIAVVNPASEDEQLGAVVLRVNKA